MPIARIDETFPLTCPLCGATLRIIAFIPETAPVHRILDPIGEPHQPPPSSRLAHHPSGSMPRSGASSTKTSISTAARLSPING